MDVDVDVGLKLWERGSWVLDLHVGRATVVASIFVYCGAFSEHQWQQRRVLTSVEHRPNRDILMLNTDWLLFLLKGFIKDCVISNLFFEEDEEISLVQKVTCNCVATSSGVHLKGTSHGQAISYIHYPHSNTSCLPKRAHSNFPNSASQLLSRTNSLLQYRNNFLDNWFTYLGTHSSHHDRPSTESSTRCQPKSRS